MMMKIYLVILVFIIWSNLIPPCSHRRIKEVSYPLISTENTCKTNGSIYDQCYTEDKNRCNSTVCCLGYTPGADNYHECINNQNCTYFMYYEYEGPVNITYENGTWGLHDLDVPILIHYTMISKRNTPHYFAFALSMDEMMGNDLVFVCELKENNIVEFYIRWNHLKETVKTNKFRTNIGSILKTEYNTSTGETRCVFTLKPNVQYFHESPRFNFSMHKDNQQHDKYYNLIAIGEVSEEKLQYHSYNYISGHVNNRWSYTNQCIITAGLPTYYQEKFHAAYMISVWVIMIPINSFIARYLKGVWSFEVYNLGPFWLIVHKCVSCATILMVLAGYLSVAAKRNYEFSGYYPVIVHSIMGFITMGIFGIEFGLGAFRLRFINERTYKRIQLLHSTLHFLVALVGYITIIVAPYFTYNAMPCEIYHFIYPFVVVQIAFHVLMVHYSIKMDKRFGFNYERSWKEYPNKVYYSEIIHTQKVTLHAVILYCYIAASAGFSALIFLSIFTEYIFGPACLPTYNHIPIKQRL